MSYTENAITVYKNLYMNSNETTPELVHKRVAAAISNNNKENKIFSRLLNNNIFRPNSPCLINANPEKQSNKYHNNLMACFVIGLDDSMESIIDMWSTCAKVYAGGGGTGFPISNLREHGASISQGGQACLTGDTIIYNDNTQVSAARQEYTIKEMYKLQTNSKRHLSKVRCMIDGGLIGNNSIVNIVNNGIADIYKITTKLGYTIKATANHRFLGYDGQWYSLDQFNIGSAIAVNGTRQNGICPRCDNNRLLMGPLSKYHGYCHTCAQSLRNNSKKMIKQVTGNCIRCGKVAKLTTDNATYPGLCPSCITSVKKGFHLSNSEDSKIRKKEQSENHSKFQNNPIIKDRMRQLNLGENNPNWKGDLVSKVTARQRLNAKYPELKQIQICSRCEQDDIRIERHHKDGNPYNNDLSNIELLCVKCHQVEHARRKSFESNDPRRIKEIFFDEIIDIEYIGKDEVFDIQMQDPYHNFIANGFVSHNSGPIEYMKTIQSISDRVKSGGKARRAANLASFRYNHPDILEFIQCKKHFDFSAINISILVDDWFMERVANGELNREFDLISPTGKVTGQLKIKDIWNDIIKLAHECGDPGLLFKTITNERNPIPSRGEILTPNPCGEVPLTDNSCCDLGSINLNKFIKNGAFDKESFINEIPNCVRFLDNIIDKTSFPNETFEKTMKETRPIGLGIMGFSDILYKLKTPYDSEEGLRIFEEICYLLTKHGFEASIDLAEEKGACKLTNEDKQKFENLLINQYNISKEYIEKFKKVGIRNTQVTSIAPTGSISISCTTEDEDCSYAFEPNMALVFEKPLSDRDTVLTIINKEFLKAFKKEFNRELTKEEFESIINNKGSVHGLNFIPEHMQRIFKTAHDISWKDKIKMQSVGQQYITLAISSTCNLPNSATINDVEEAYILAWKSKLKGITVYRDGCLSEQPVNFGKIVKHKDKEEFIPEFPILLPNRLSGTRFRIKTPRGHLYVQINELDGKIVEVFLNMGKTGQLENLLLTNLSKVISKSLQYGVPLEELLDQFENQGGDGFFFTIDEDKNIGARASSILDAISQLIRHFYFKEEVTLTNKTVNTDDLENCPVCNKKTLTHKGTSCRGGMCLNADCGYTACG